MTNDYIQVAMIGYGLGGQAFHANVVPWLRNGAPPPVDPNDAVAGLEIIEAARKSAAECRVVAL